MTGAAASIQRTMTPRQWGMLLALSVLWGASFYFTAIAIRELPTLTVVTLRVGFAALALWALIPLLGERPPAGRAAWTAFIGMALLNNVVPFSLFVWAQSQIPSGLASILNATTPLFGVLVAHALVPDEPLTGRRFAGVLLGFGGVVLMLGPGVLASSAGGALLAELACLGGALSYALSGVYGRRFAALGVSPLQTAAGQITASTLILLPFSLAVDRPWLLPMPGAATWGAILGSALLSTVLAYLLFFRILAAAGATNLLLVTLLIPVSALLLGSAFLGESMGLREVGGMALIGLGLAAIDGRPIAFLLRRTSRAEG